jgi:hypothetical protein
MLHDNAMMHAMQTAHTFAESALEKVLDILGETRPSGEQLARRAPGSSRQGHPGWRFCPGRHPTTGRVGRPA